MNKRFCLQKLTNYDPRTKVETWRDTNQCNDRVSALMNFFADDMRIIDTQTGREVDRRVDLDSW